MFLCIDVDLLFMEIIIDNTKINITTNINNKKEIVTFLKEIENYLKNITIKTVRIELQVIFYLDNDKIMVSSIIIDNKDYYSNIIRSIKQIFKNNSKTIDFCIYKNKQNVYNYTIETKIIFKEYV